MIRDDSMKLDPTADLASSIFNRMQEILGDVQQPAHHRESSIRHVSVEEALQELIDIKNSTLQLPPASSQ